MPKAELLLTLQKIIINWNKLVEQAPSEIYYFSTFKRNSTPFLSISHRLHIMSENFDKFLCRFFKIISDGIKFNPLLSSSQAQV